MSESPHASANSDPSARYAGVKAQLDEVLGQIANYDPSDTSATIPGVAGTDIAEFISGAEPVPTDLLVDYAAVLKFGEDALSKFGGRGPIYWTKIEKIGQMDVANLRSLYEAGDGDNPLRTMLAHQITETEISNALLPSTFNILRKIYGEETIPELMNSHPDDSTCAALKEVLKSGGRKVSDLFQIDIKHKPMDQKTQERRVWMRDALGMATDISDPEQADSYVYAISKQAFGEYTIDTLVSRVNSYGPEKLRAIKEFANISALSSYSDEQLDRMYRLSQGDEAEIKRLTEHDVNVLFINMDGDHNGISAGVAERLDDDAERTLFFEIDRPEQVYEHMKKLHSMGIVPSTLIFASHGSNGQHFISERPALDSDKRISHVTTVLDQDLAEHLVANSDDKSLVPYDVANANGLVRSVQRFMQPSRAIDDADQDLGRKKLISLSCEFDGQAKKGSLGNDGEVIKGEPTTLLRRLGEVMVKKLSGERIDIYGADISTNSQTRTDHGFHYNQLVDSFIMPYPATVLHIDDKDMHWHQLDEVKLRKSS